MKSIKLLFIIFILLLFIPPVSALTLIGRPMDKIVYQPGATITNHYQISDVYLPVEASVSSDVFKVITITPIVNNEFDVIINFPEEEFIPTGMYRQSVSVREIAEPSSSIGSLITVSKIFTIIVYSYEKDIEVFFTAPSINQGSNLTFQLNVNSMSYEDIGSVKARINVYDHENNLLGSLLTSEKPLPSLSSLSFSIKFDASKLPPGNYWAEALVNYDGQEKEINSTFLIGNIDLTLKDYTSELQQGFSDFSIKVANNWGNELRNVYAKVFINNQELLHTPSINLDSWKEGELNGIMKIDFAPGVYQGIIKLFFEGESKEVPITVRVLASVQPKKEINYLLLLVPLMYILMFAAIIILIYLLLKSIHKEKKDKLAKKKR